jgi:hypothetical protein
MHTLDTMNRTLSAIALSAALAVSVSGCSADFLESFSFAGGAPTSNGGTTAPEFAQAFDANDVMFAQMMIVHHEQAIEMSDLAMNNTTNPDVLALAESISKAQVPEVATMKSWLDAAGASSDHMHDMMMPGLADEAMMADLRTLTGPSFDSLFLMTMIQHHEGAIAMADDVLASTANDDVTALAQDVKSAQTLEIEAMYALLGP